MSQAYDSINADIRVKIGDIWRPADEQQKAAYIAYKSRNHYYRETPHIHENGITIFREDNNGYNKNDCYMPTFFRLSGSIRNPGAKYPIIDMNDLCVFLMDGVVGNGSRNGAGWVKARNYQAWAYVDFIYDRAVKKCYMSKYSTYLAFPPGFDSDNVVTIDMDDLPPNIIFSISRNENNSVYYEKNDSTHSRVRICDNEYARVGFLGYYTRITMDIPIQIIPPAPALISAAGGNSIQSYLSGNNLPPIIETINEEDQCILCYKNMKNVEYKPCNHKISCIVCFERLVKKECPICKAEIIKIIMG